MSNGARGRPKKPLLQDEDRYGVAMGIALRDVFNVSERQSFDMVVALFGCEETGESEAAYQYTIKSEPGSPATINGRAATIRQKANKDRTPEEAAWLLVMALCFAIIFEAKQYDACAARIRELAASVDEHAFAEAMLIPMLWDKFNGPIFSRGPF